MNLMRNQTRCAMINSTKYNFNLRDFGIIFNNHFQALPCAYEKKLNNNGIKLDANINTLQYPFLLSEH